MRLIICNYTSVEIVELTTTTDCLALRRFAQALLVLLTLTFAPDTVHQRAGDLDGDSRQSRVCIMDVRVPSLLQLSPPLVRV